MNNRFHAQTHLFFSYTQSRSKVLTQQAICFGTIYTYRIHIFVDENQKEKQFLSIYTTFDHFG